MNKNDLAKELEILQEIERLGDDSIDIFICSIFDNTVYVKVNDNKVFKGLNDHVEMFDNCKYIKKKTFDQNRIIRQGKEIWMQIVLVLEDIEIYKNV